MRILLHNKPITGTMTSPLSGNEIDFSIRAYCPHCGCLISHSSVFAVEKALKIYQSCKKCGCNEVAVKYVAIEEILGKPEIE